MCFCVYVSMVCLQCMLYDDVYLHNKKKGKIIFFPCLVDNSSNTDFKGYMFSNTKN